MTDTLRQHYINSWAQYADAHVYPLDPRQLSYDHLDPTLEGLERMKPLVVEHLMTHFELGDQMLASCVAAAAKALIAALPARLDVEIERVETPGSPSALCFTVCSGERFECWVRMDLSHPTRVALWHGRGRTRGEIYRSRAIYVRAGTIEGLSSVIADGVVQMLQGLRTKPAPSPFSQ